MLTRKDIEKAKQQLWNPGNSPYIAVLPASMVDQLCTENEVMSKRIKYLEAVIADSVDGLVKAQNPDYSHYSLDEGM